MSETSDCIVFSDAAIKRGDHIIWQHGTFAIPTGSVTAIVGTNGTGKTTMMRAELGLLPLCHGSLTVLGKPAGEMNNASDMCRRAMWRMSIPISPPNNPCCWA